MSGVASLRRLTRSGPLIHHGLPDFNQASRRSANSADRSQRCALKASSFILRICWSTSFIFLSGSALRIRSSIPSLRRIDFISRKSSSENRPGPRVTDFIRAKLASGCLRNT
ncbi:hypothetical protein BU26DRAFT_48161 [Trematosphaeria pertusa]|uniref:Uncharacterized protein n=1 Tax=Trematosphaeria pertusa TaxID=390896 RepID=A0A6A6I7J8_9PLEO|nr:uncharacterized protein BU26DRAFT_48161 [Trematosphaeria pertusa]KAF2246534.1 hypothetical protein BU26DRAFT_48161 [Trematosphaeria pertusa]